MRRLVLLCAVAFASGGCLWDTETRQGVPIDPMRVTANKKLEQANVAACTWVFTIGQRILQANPELPMVVVFRAAGYPKPEIFHQGTTSIVVTQPLVEMCKSDAELAALLCVELGRMVAEREALAPLEARQGPEPKPPIEPISFPGTAGVANGDELRLRELARYEADQKRHAAGAHLPDPMELARRFLRRTGYPEDSLEKIKPILRAAANGGDLERQMSTSGKTMPFAPAGS
jgi:hypothetical protein